jgi:hypothetical protein
VPTPSEQQSGLWQPLPVTRRYLRTNAQRAMGGSLVRALVELITNARDSGLRLFAAGRLIAEEISTRRVEIDYIGRPGARRLVVRDRFEGMSGQTMRDKLLLYGETASGFAEDNYVRGVNARGAKDVGAIGEVKFESICGTTYAECTIRLGQYSEPMERVVTAADRERMQIQNGNGTVVSLTPFENITVPVFEALARDLEHHVEIRYRADGQPRLSMAIRELRDRSGIGREHDIVGFEPGGELILERDIAVPGFEAYGGPAKLRLLRSSEALTVSGSRGGLARMWRSEAGIIVGDGHTAHDITFFHARGADDPAAEHVFGSLHVPQIPKLLREYEQFEEKREEDPGLKPSEMNPEQVTDPDRLGLNYEHPFVRAVEEQVRPLVESAIAALQRELTPPSQDRVSIQLRQALDRLGEQLAERLENASGNQNKGEGIPLGLSLIPSGLRLELGRAKRIGVYYRVEGSLPQELPPCSITATNEAVYLATPSIQLEPVAGRPGMFRGSFEIAGRQLSDLVMVRIVLGQETASARVSVREPIDGFIVLDRDLQFSQRRYSSVPGRRKRIEVFADPALSDMDVEVSLVANAVALSSTVIHLEYDAKRGIAAGELVAEAGNRARDSLRARCGDLVDETEIVFEPLNAKPRLDFAFEDVENFGPGRRFLWDNAARNKLHIAARHLTLSRVLGPPSENWPGQNSPQSRAILAELLAEAYVARRIQADLPSLGTGPENSVDPVEYESYRYRYFEEVFPLCHGLLTPAFQAA